MSYAEIKPEFYQMFQPGSPWHAGAPGWKEAPWPGWGRNPLLVGPSRLAVDGFGAYFTNRDTQPISGLGAYFKNIENQPISGLGCPCAAKGTGDDTDPNAPVTFPWAKFLIGAGLVAATVYVATRPKLIRAVVG